MSCKYRKTTTAAVLCLLALALVAALMCAGFDSGVSARADQGVKQLVNVGENASAGAVWVEAGLPETWVGAVEQVRDSSQADGGDVILRNDVNGNDFVAGEAAWARTSMNPALGAYAVNGMEMNFYLSAAYKSGETLKIIFCEKSGWYLNSSYAFQLVISKSSATSATVSVMYKANSAGELYTYYSNTGNVPMHFDYDYFADRASGFTAPVGTLNSIRFAADDGALKLYVNDTELVDLSGLQRSVLTNISDGVYFNLWSQASGGKLAMRIVDIKENELTESETGAPDGYALIGDDGQITHMLDKMGNAMISGKAEAGYDYYVRRDTSLAAGNFEMDFRLRAENSAAVKFDAELNGGDGKFLVFAFEFTGANTADVAIKYICGDDTAEIGRSKVTLYRDGRANNITVHKAVKYFARINGENVTLDYAEANAAVEETGDKAVAQFRVTADGKVSLYGVVTKEYSSTGVRSLSGYLLDNMRIFGGENPIGLAATDEQTFGARYISTLVDIAGFGASFGYGDYDGDGTLRIVVTARNDGFYDSSRDAAVVAELRKVNGADMLILYANDGNGEKLVRAASVNFDGEYDTRHSVSFGSTGDVYAMYFDDSAAVLTAEQSAQIDKAIAAVDGRMAQMQFVCGGSATLFYPFECGSFPVSGSVEGWSAGGVGGLMRMGDGVGGVRVRFGGGSAVCDTPVPLDGFSLSMRAYHNFDRVEAFIALGSGKNWYRNEAGVALSLAYIDDSTARIRLYVTDRIGDSYVDKAVASVELPFEWNNGLRNSLDVRYESTTDKWVAYVNGAALEGDYSAEIAKLAGYYSDNAAYLQLWGNGDVTLDITDMAVEHSGGAPGVSGDAKLLASYGDKLVSLDLGKLFTDPDGDALYFRIAEGGGYIDGGVWYGNVADTNTVRVVAYDGKGGECEYTFTLDAKNAKSGCGGKVSAFGTLSVAVAVLAVCCAAVALRRFACRVKK